MNPHAGMDTQTSDSPIRGTTPLLLVLILDLITAACSGSPPGNAPVEGTQAAIEVAGNATIEEMKYTITGPNGLKREATVDVAASTQPTFVVGLPTGGLYTIVVKAQSRDGALSCTGSAQFSVQTDSTTHVPLRITCRATAATGSASIDGEINVCPNVDPPSALPAEVAVGGKITLVAGAKDPDEGPSPLSFAWSAPVGAFEDPTASSTTYSCSRAGVVELTLVVSDGDPACDSSVSVEVKCSPGCAPRTPVGSPPASSQHGMTYFKAKKETLLATREGSAMGLYAFDTPRRQWFHVDVSQPVPPARTNPVFEYDEASGKAVLFGGDNGGPLADLWEFDGCRWSDRTPAALPPDWPSPRWAAASAFDPATQHVIITTGIEIALSTWTWADGLADATVYEFEGEKGTFRVRPPLGTPPAPRGGAVAVGDSTRNLVFLATGLLAGNQGDSQVYRWDGTSGSWTATSPSPVLSERMFAGIYRDAVADRIVVTGGQFTGWLWKPDYYQYAAATDWFSVVGPDATYNRFWAPIAYDSDDNVAIQFSGYLADSQYYGPVGPSAAPSDTRMITGNGVVTTLSPE